jgi:hypothetical protein
MHLENHRWVTGDQFGLAFPADPAGLRSGGPRFLTDAFRVAGVLGGDNSVTRITGFDEVGGGSTGRKVALAVEYHEAAPGLHADLFVKFSRDLHNPIRDRGKTQMEPEVRFASLSRAAAFPIAVPHVQFGDYHRQSGTGILIMERIDHGGKGIERRCHKCLDYEMPEPRSLPRATHRAGPPRGHPSIRALARRPDLALPTGRAGRDSGRPGAAFHRQAGTTVDAVDGIRRNPSWLAARQRWVSRVLGTLRNDVPRIAHHEHTVARQLAADSDYVALCHWNANIDNAWFWRDAEHILHCGLMDWGCVSQMNVGMAIWGAMSGAETDMWNRHLDELLHLFVAEVHRYGGPNLDPDRLRRHTLLYAAVMGVAWLLDVPALVRKRFGVAAPRNRRDPRIKNDESVHAPLQMPSNLLSLWQRCPLADLLDAALAESSAEGNEGRRAG